MFRVGQLPRVWALLLLQSAICLAQVNTATIYGAVTDPSGAAVPQASVNISNHQTGANWNVTTNAQGEYTVTFLPAGTYTIVSRTASFKESRNTNVELAGGQEVRLRYALAIGEVSDSITVVAETPIINTANAEQTHNLSNLRVTELPTADRDWSALLNLGPGLTVVNGNTLSMNGLPQDGFRFTVDGANASGSGESETMTSLGYIKAVSLEAVREVNVTGGIAPAESSPTMSGNVNVITKSGINEVHGSLFENNRVEDFAARNQFLATRPPVTFNQFGGSLSGPIIKNKLFYFGVFEGYRSRAFTSVNGNVPTAEFRATAVAANPDYKAFLDTFPLPNNAYAPGAVTGFYQSAGVGRRRQQSRQCSRCAESRFGYNRFTRSRLDKIFTLGVSAITGSLGFSNSGELMENLGVNYSFDQIIALNRGRHSLKMGVLFQMWESGRNNETVPEFQFANAADMLANRPSQITISFAVRPYTLRNWVNGYFIQDDFRITRNFILNVGLRADWFSVPKEDSGRLFNRTGPFGIGPFTSPDSVYESSKFDFSPRLGFAWTVTPQTVIRGGGGIFTSARNQFGGPVELVQNAIDEPTVRCSAQPKHNATV